MIVAVAGLLADLTCEEVRTRAMAPMGSFIDFTFAASIMVLPLFTRYVNIFGLFAFTGALCVCWL